jgi:hypothetical protein
MEGIARGLERRGALAVARREVAMRLTLLIFALLLAATAAHAGKIYKWVDEQGNVLYTDQPRKGAREIKIAASPPASVTRAPQTVPRQAGSLLSREEEGVKYTSVTLSAPDENTIRDNAGNVAIGLSVVPDMVGARGDHIRLTLDGHALDSDYYPPEVVLPGMDQGSHVLQATVVDKDGRVLIRSDPLEFYLKHWSLDNPIGPGNYPATYPPQPYKPVYPAQVYTPVYPPQGATKPR